ncbi:MAG: LytTR family DNA-binding domain-containing protein [Myxococcota bacterium]
MRVALIEDEVPALEHLERLVGRLRPDAEVIAALRTVRQTRAWLATPAASRCDLVLADIQLGDGLSLDAFAGVDLAVPVVFTTAYDHHLAPALAGNGIAYLLKPIGEADLAAALDKHARLERHYVGALGALARQVTAPTRLVGRRGLDWVGVPVEDVRWVRVRNGVTVAATADGAELMLEAPLNQVQQQLEPAFFRVNRWYLVSLPAIERVRPEGRGRLRLLLHPTPDEPVVVPQENAAAFRAWFGMP